jgi:ubiquinone biosynthesis protein UbiJ
VATNASNLAKKRMQVRDNLADVVIETWQKVAPRSTERLIAASIQWLEAHREFLAERIERLEKAKAKVAKASPRRAARKVPVRGGARRTKKASRG